MTGWLSLRPCWLEPRGSLNWDSNSMKLARATENITDQGFFFLAYSSLLICALPLILFYRFISY